MKKSDKFLFLDNPALKELMTLLIKKAGKSKDEILQMLFKEIGTALAAGLKDPIEKLILENKLHIHIELEEKKKPIRKAHRKTKAASKSN